MSRPRLQITVLSLFNDEEYTFSSQAECDAFLGRPHGYTATAFRRGTLLKLKKTGEKFRILNVKEISHWEYDENGKKKEKKKYHPTGRYTLTLCWGCQKASKNGCSWARCFKPVEGWTATPTIIRSQTEIKNKVSPIIVHSFAVKACPEFVAD